MPEDSAISFNALVLMLATSAAVHFGDVPDPSGTKPPPDLQAAAQMIELLDLLQTKTRGNLTEDEQRFLEQVLFELRMHFVEAQKGEKRIVEP